MSDYSKTTNFTAKDALASGHPDKVIKGADFDTEFDNIVTASSTKANKIVTPVLNNIVTQSAAGDLLDSGVSFTSSDDKVDNFPSGTLMLFQQTAAPTGWTKQTTHDNKGLRVVTGTASSGGTDSFTTTFSASKATEGHALTITEMPSHDHNGVTGSGTAAYTNQAYSVAVIAGTGKAYNTTHTHSIDAEGGDTAHAHDISMDLEYVDIIIAAKD